LTSHLIGFNRPEGVEREKHDFYATSPKAISPLLKLLGWQYGGKFIFENSCGHGHLSKSLIQHGHTVISTDLVDRGYGASGVDFLKPSIYDTMPFDGIIMNPPYKHALEFIEKSLTIAPTVCAFLRLSFLESEGRYEFFQRRPPSIVGVFSDRVPSAKNADFEKYSGSTVAYAWFIWQGTSTGDPVIKWLRL